MYEIHEYADFIVSHINKRSTKTVLRKRRKYTTADRHNHAKSTRHS